MARNGPKVIVAKGAFYNILRNIVEQDSRESIGDLIGREEGKDHLVLQAYPWTFARCTTHEARHDNDLARKRLRALDVALFENGSKSFVIGHYHSHVLTPDEPRGYMHRIDADFFREVSEKDGLLDSIELIVTVRRKTYECPHPIGEMMRYYRNKMNYRVNTTPLSGYDTTFSAFHLTQKNWRELPVRQSVLEVK